MKISRFFIIGFALLLLVGCWVGKYSVKVNLAPEKVQELQANIDALEREIEDFVPSEDKSIPWQALIDLSRAYEELGELGKAIAVYEDVVKEGKPSKAILNNLGRLYEKTEQYDKAVVMYQRINDQFLDRGYLYDITWAYIRAGDRKNAEKYFNAWQLEFKKTDTQIQDAIKKLREAEKA